MKSAEPIAGAEVVPSGFAVCKSEITFCEGGEVMKCEKMLQVIEMDPVLEVEFRAPLKILRVADLLVDNRKNQVQKICVDDFRNR